MNEQSREQQLVSAARDGDMDAFEALVHLYEKRVFALTLRESRGCRRGRPRGVSRRLAGAGILPGRGQLLHLAVPAGVQRLRGLAAA